MAEDKRDDNIRTLPLRDNGEGLTARQVKVLEVIRSAVATRGYPPSLREIGDAVGLTSPSSVAHQLTALERKGYLRRDPNRPRAIEVVSPDAADSPDSGATATTHDLHGYRGGASPDDVDVTGSAVRAALVGRISIRPQVVAGRAADPVAGLSESLCN